MIKYYVNEKKKEVYAVITDCEFDVINHLRKNKCEALVGEEALLSSTFKGTARCKPEDEFDIEEGKRIAAYHLFAKYRHAFTRAIKRVEKRLDKINAEIKDVNYNYAKLNLDNFFKG